MHPTLPPGPLWRKVDHPTQFALPSREMPVSDVEERTLGDLTVRIDRLICVGFGDCIDGFESIFKFDDEGIATFAADAEQADAGLLLEACRACPVDAITVFDPEGEQIVP